MGQRKEKGHSRTTYAKARHVQEHACWAGVSHSAELESARKVPETSDGRLERELRATWPGLLLLLEQDKAITHSLIY